MKNNKCGSYQKPNRSFDLWANIVKDSVAKFS